MTNVFLWCTGQDDNIGDVVLRRRLLHAVSAPGARVTMYVGTSRGGFAESMIGSNRAHTSDVRSRLRWMAQLFVGAARGPVVLVHNAGEIRLDAKTVQSQIALLIPQLLVRSRGGLVLRLGCAVHDRPGLAARTAGALVKLLGRSTTRATWRDTESGRTFGRAPVVPDWGFDDTGPEVTSVISERTSLVLTFRSDRPALPDKALHELTRFADAHALTVRTVVQVRRDDESMARLAEQIGCEHVGWPPGRSHREQELVVRAEFAAARIVVSDRIHALIVGCTEGAVPAAVLTYPDSKVQRHFDSADIGRIVLDEVDGRENEIDEFLSELLRRDTEIADSLCGAQQRIRDLDATVHADIASLHLRERR